MNNKLFSDNFPIISTAKDLDELCKKYPDYDRGYVCQGSGAGYDSRRTWMQELWEEFEPYADNHFLGGFKRDFSGRSWELYLGVTFLRRGYSLDRIGNKGPDLKVIKDGFYTYIEAVSSTPGSGPDQVPDLLEKTVGNVPEDEMQLRVANSLSYKKLVYDRYLAEGIIKKEDPFIIAINRSAAGLIGDPFIPLIIKCLFGVGHPTLQIPIGNTPRKRKPKSSWSGRPILTKKSGSNVPMLFFEDSANAGISAIIYSTDNILNSPKISDQMGENICIIHNPKAANPTPEKFFIFGEERRVLGEDLHIVRKARKWDKY